VITETAHRPKFLTSDWGSTFKAGLFEETCKILEIDHHVSLPHHPEGHAPIERVFRDVNNMIRALVAKGYEDWPRYIGAVQYALNTAYSRALGMSPFEVVYGRQPQSSLRAALEGERLGQAVADDDAIGDPAEFSLQQLKRAIEIAKLVEEERQKVHAQNAHLWARKAQGQSTFEPGDPVMRRVQPKDKTQLRWEGPFFIARRADGIANAYVITDICGKNEQTEATANLHIYDRGSLTDEQLEAEATKPGEYRISRVRDH
jgi:hypothetical protein